MKAIEYWHPTKFVRTRCGLRASRNPEYVGIGSRFITDIIAQHYDQAIQVFARGRLLDMGCGHVPLYEAYRSLVTENICIDWENTRHLNPHLDHTVDLNGLLPFEAASFDTILITDVLEHIAEPQKTMAEITRVLRPGGTLILGVPFFYWLHEPPHDYYRYTEYALRRFCELSGLTIISLEPYGGLPEIFADLTAKGLGLLPHWISVCLRPVHTAASAICKTLVGYRLSEWSRSSFPLGYVLVAGKETNNV